MIEHILVVGQGPNDVGFLQGLRDRMGCQATVVDYRTDPNLRQSGTYTLKKNARFLVDEHLREHPVHLIVRITDGGTSRPQDVIRQERARFPECVHEMLVCGVCDRDIESWMAIDVSYAAERLKFDPAKLPSDRVGRSGFIKHCITRCVEPGQSYAGFVAQYVRDVPRETFRKWLSDPALGQFYDDCRAAAMRANCPVPNERN